MGYKKVLLAVTLNMIFCIQASGGVRDLTRPECDSSCNYTKAADKVGVHYVKKIGKILEKKTVRKLEQYGIEKQHAVNTVVLIKALVEKKIETRTKIHKYYYLDGEITYREQKLKITFRYHF